MKKDSKIFIAGHKGMVGRAIHRLLKKENYENILTISKDELDLRNIQKVKKFFGENKPEYVFLAAAKVGGIYANDNNPAEFIYDNLLIQSNIIDASYKNRVKKLLFLGSSCIYPKFSKQPIKEQYLLDGKLEPTNEPYAIAKIAGIKMCQSYNKQYGTNYISCMPTNLYGRFDNFDGLNSHVLPALLKKFHIAKKNRENKVVIWGTGSPRREFLNVDDAAEACFFLMKYYNDSEIINVGTGEDISIEKLASLINRIVESRTEIVYDENMPDGTSRKLLDTSKINELGWSHKIDLEEGIKSTYDWCLENKIFE